MSTIYARVLPIGQPYSPRKLWGRHIVGFDQNDQFWGDLCVYEQVLSLAWEKNAATLRSSQAL